MSKFHPAKIRMVSLVGILSLLAACSAGTIEAGASASVDQSIGPLIVADADIIMDASASAMSAVTSVEFSLDAEGGPVYIDQFEALTLEDLLGQFTIPSKAQALLTVGVNGNLTTQLGAVAIDDIVWLSNPVTGDFEPLPEGFDLDPSKFFDPTGGWEPLLNNLIDVELVGLEDNGYHLTGQALPDDVAAITVGLIRQEVPVDLWVDSVSALVNRMEFTTIYAGETTSWSLEFTDYGADFTIEPPVTS